MIEQIFFGDWTSLLRTLVVGVLAYAALVLLLRISGKRTLSKMNAFDLVVTVALGSTLASSLLDKSVTLADGAAAFGLLVALQWSVAWTAVRSRTLNAIIKGEPTLLVRDGDLLQAAMRAERITKDEVLAAIRQSGEADLARIACVVLESDGSLSVVPKAAP